MPRLISNAAEIPTKSTAMAYGKRFTSRARKIFLIGDEARLKDLRAGA